MALSPLTGLLLARCQLLPASTPCRAFLRIVSDVMLAGGPPVSITDMHGICNSEQYHEQSALPNHSCAPAIAIMQPLEKVRGSSREAQGTSSPGHLPSFPKCGMSEHICSGMSACRHQRDLRLAMSCNAHTCAHAMGMMLPLGMHMPVMGIRLSSEGCCQVEFKQVAMRYRPGLPLVLHGLSVTVEAGARCGVVRLLAAPCCKLHALQQCHLALQQLYQSTAWQGIILDLALMHAVL